MLELIIDSLRKQKQKKILIIIQFVIGFTALIFGLSRLEDLLKYQEQLKPLAPLGAVQIYHCEQEQDGYDTDILKQYEIIIEKIKEQHLVEKLGLFDELFLDVSKEGTDKLEVKSIMANYDLLSMADFQLKEGNISPILEYNPKDTVIPVIVSEALAKTYACGSKIEACDYDENEIETVYTLEVVGVLKPSVRYWSGGSSSMTEGLTKNEEEFMILPQFQSFSNDMAYTFNTLAVLSGKLSEEEALSKIQEIYQEAGHTVQFTTIKEQIHQYYVRQKPIIMTTLGFAAILLLLSVLGCVGTILTDVLSRKEEFGIYISLGFTRKNLQVLILGEIMLLFMISYIIAVIFGAVLVYGIMPTGNPVSVGRILGTACLVMLFCGVCSIIMPLQKMNSMQPTELINERKE